MLGFSNGVKHKSTLRLPSLKARACSGLTLHFDKLSVLSLSKEAVLYTPP